MMSQLKSCCLAALLVIAASTSLAAQSDASARAGEQIRVEVVGPATASIGFRCAGQVKHISLDTLVVASAGDCPPGNYLADLRVVRGDHGSRLTHIVLGVLAGGVAGALLTRVTASSCGGQGCVGDDQGYVSGIRTTMGTLTGAVVGGVAGLTLPAGPRWVRVDVARPLRVVGLDVHPSLRVALRRSRDR